MMTGGATRCDVVWSVAVRWTTCRGPNELAASTRVLSTDRSRSRDHVMARGASTRDHLSPARDDAPTATSLDSVPRHRQPVPRSQIRLAAG